MQLRKLFRLASAVFGVYALGLTVLFVFELFDVGNPRPMEVFYAINFFLLGMYFLGYGVTGEKRVSRMLGKLRDKGLK